MSNKAKLIFVLIFISINVIVKSQHNMETDVYDLNTERTKSFDEHFYAKDDFMRQLKQDVQDKCTVRDHASSPDFFWFAPAVKAILKNATDSVTFSNDCFQVNTASFEKLEKDETILTISSEKPTGESCKDSYIIAMTTVLQIRFIYKEGTSRIILSNLTDDDLSDINVNGVKIFGFCQGFFTEIRSIFDTAELYLGGLGVNKDSWIPLFRPSVPDYMVKANVDFIQRFTNYTQNSRGDWGTKVIDIDKSEIKSGDFLAISRLDGVDPLVMLGSGSHIGHSAVCFWVDNELYVMESQAGWYWPRAGIQINKWDDWIEWANNADFMVAILPLKEEVRAKFDVDKAYQWYKSVEGLNYGFHNFVFTWLDTERDNWPNWVDSETLFFAIGLFDRVARKYADVMFGEGLNLRLGIKGYSVREAILIAATQGISAGNLFAMPEQYGWKYSDGMNFVCSCFAMGLYINGGIFGDIQLLPNEFGPKDVYQLNIFDKSYKDKRPQVCQDADPDLEYCQIMGKYQIVLNNYSTIEPYTHMNEKCPSIAPDYIRPDGC
jgi:hypothetical protein